jgi:hypothetical protein
MIDVRVLIIRSIDGYRVRVLAPGPPARSWLKVYVSKLSCMSELEWARLAATGESNELLQSDFDVRGTMLVIHTKADSDMLTMLGFVEQRQLRTN